MDYFTIKQQFYTGNYKNAIEEIAKQGSIDDTLLYYKNRSLMALQKPLSEETDIGLQKVFDSYVEFLNTRDIHPVEKAVASDKGKYSLNLLACAQAVLGNHTAAWETCNDGLALGDGKGNPELLLTAVQVAVANNQHAQAATLISSYIASNEELNEDEIILNLAESIVNFHTCKETVGSNFYLYEELCQTFPSWKTQLGLLNLQLQQGNLPEAASIIEMLEGEFYQDKEGSHTFAANLLSSKITYTVMNGGDASALREEMHEKYPDHPYVKANTENNAIFDAIVSKYEE